MSRERKSNFLASNRTHNFANYNDFDVSDPYVSIETSTKNSKPKNRVSSPARSRLPVRSSQKRGTSQNKNFTMRTLKPPKFDFGLINNDQIPSYKPQISSNQNLPTEKQSNPPEKSRRHYNNDYLSRTTTKETENTKSKTIQPKIRTKRNIYQIQTSPIKSENDNNESDSKPPTPEVNQIKTDNKIQTKELQFRSIQKVPPHKEIVTIRHQKVDKTETRNLIHNLIKDNKKLTDDKDDFYNDDSLDDFVSQEKLAAQEDKTPSPPTKSTTNYSRQKISLNPKQFDDSTIKQSKTYQYKEEQPISSKYSQILDRNKANNLKTNENSQKDLVNTNNRIFTRSNLIKNEDDRKNNKQASTINLNRNSTYEEQTAKKVGLNKEENNKFKPRSLRTNPDEQINGQHFDAFLAFQTTNRLTQKSDNIARLHSILKNEPINPDSNIIINKNSQNKKTTAPETLKSEFLREQPNRVLNNQPDIQRLQRPVRRSQSESRTHVDMEPKGTYSSLLRSRKNNKIEKTEEEITEIDSDDDIPKNKFKKNIHFKVGSEKDVKQPKLVAQPMQLLMSNKVQGQILKKPAIRRKHQPEEQKEIQPEEPKDILIEEEQKENQILEEINYFTRSVKKSSPVKPNQSDSDSDYENENPINKADLYARIKINPTAQRRNVSTSSFISRKPKTDDVKSFDNSNDDFYNQDIEKKSNKIDQIQPPKTAKNKDSQPKINQKSSNKKIQNIFSRISSNVRASSVTRTIQPKLTVQSKLANTNRKFNSPSYQDQISNLEDDLQIEKPIRKLNPPKFDSPPLNQQKETNIKKERKSLRDRLLYLSDNDDSFNEEEIESEFDAHHSKNEYSTEFKQKFKDNYKPNINLSNQMNIDFNNQINQNKSNSIPQKNSDDDQYSINEDDEYSQNDEIQNNYQFRSPKFKEYSNNNDIDSDQNDIDSKNSFNKRYYHTSNDSPVVNRNSINDYNSPTIEIDNSDLLKRSIDRNVIKRANSPKVKQIKDSPTVNQINRNIERNSINQINSFNHTVSPTIDFENRNSFKPQIDQFERNSIKATNSPKVTQINDSPTANQFNTTSFKRSIERGSRNKINHSNRHSINDYNSPTIEIDNSDLLERGIDKNVIKRANSPKVNQIKDSPTVNQFNRSIERGSINKINHSNHTDSPTINFENRNSNRLHIEKDSMKTVNSPKVNQINDSTAVNQFDRKSFKRSIDPNSITKSDRNRNHDLQSKEQVNSRELLRSLIRSTFSVDNNVNSKKLKDNEEEKTEVDFTVEDEEINNSTGKRNNKTDDSQSIQIEIDQFLSNQNKKEKEMIESISPKPDNSFNETKKTPKSKFIDESNNSFPSGSPMSNKKGSPSPLYIQNVQNNKPISNDFNTPKQNQPKKLQISQEPLAIDCTLVDHDQLNSPSLENNQSPYFMQNQKQISPINTQNKSPSLPNNSPYWNQNKSQLSNESIPYHSQSSKLTSFRNNSIRNNSPCKSSFEKNNSPYLIQNQKQISPHFLDSKQKKISQQTQVSDPKQENWFKSLSKNTKRINEQQINNRANQSKSLKETIRKKQTQLNSSNAKQEIEKNKIEKHDLHEDDNEDLSTDQSINRIIFNNKQNFIEISNSSSIIKPNSNAIQFKNTDDLNDFNLFTLSDVSSSNEEETENENLIQVNEDKEEIIPIEMSDFSSVHMDDELSNDESENEPIQPSKPFNQRFKLNRQPSKEVNQSPKKDQNNSTIIQSNQIRSNSINESKTSSPAQNQDNSVSRNKLTINPGENQINLSIKPNQNDSINKKESQLTTSQIESNSINKMSIDNQSSSNQFNENENQQQSNQFNENENQQQSKRENENENQQQSKRENENQKQFNSDINDNNSEEIIQSDYLQLNIYKYDQIEKDIEISIEETKSFNNGEIPKEKVEGIDDDDETDETLNEQLLNLINIDDKNQNKKIQLNASNVSDTSILNVSNNQYQSNELKENSDSLHSENLDKNDSDDSLKSENMELIQISKDNSSKSDASNQTPKSEIPQLIEIENDLLISENVESNPITKEDSLHSNNEELIESQNEDSYAENVESKHNENEHSLHSENVELKRNVELIQSENDSFHSENDDLNQIDSNNGVLNDDESSLLSSESNQHDENDLANTSNSIDNQQNSLMHNKEDIINTTDLQLNDNDKQDVLNNSEEEVDNVLQELNQHIVYQLSEKVGYEIDDSIIIRKDVVHKLNEIAQKNQTQMNTQQNDLDNFLELESKINAQIANEEENVNELTVDQIEEEESDNDSQNEPEIIESKEEENEIQIEEENMEAIKLNEEESHNESQNEQEIIESKEEENEFEDKIEEEESDNDSQNEPERIESKEEENELEDQIEEENMEAIKLNEEESRNESQNEQEIIESKEENEIQIEEEESDSSESIKEENKMEQFKELNDQQNMDLNQSKGEIDLPNQSISEILFELNEEEETGSHYEQNKELQNGINEESFNSIEDDKDFLKGNEEEDIELQIKPEAVQFEGNEEEEIDNSFNPIEHYKKSQIFKQNQDIEEVQLEGNHINSQNNSNEEFNSQTNADFSNSSSALLWVQLDSPQKQNMVNLNSNSPEHLQSQDSPSVLIQSSENSQNVSQQEKENHGNDGEEWAQFLAILESNEQQQEIAENEVNKFDATASPIHINDGLVTPKMEKGQNIASPITPGYFSMTENEIEKNVSLNPDSNEIELISQSNQTNSFNNLNEDQLQSNQTNSFNNLNEDQLQSNQTNSFNNLNEDQLQSLMTENSMSVNQVDDQLKSNSISNQNDSFNDEQIEINDELPNNLMSFLEIEAKIQQNDSINQIPNQNQSNSINEVDLPNKENQHNSIKLNTDNLASLNGTSTQAEVNGYVNNNDFDSVNIFDQSFNYDSNAEEEIDHVEIIDHSSDSDPLRTPPDSPF